MKTLLERRRAIAEFQQTKYTRLKRTGESYVQTKNWAVRNITRCLDELSKSVMNDQNAQLIRDEIDEYLKRYHDYCIKDQIGAHYREVGALKKDCDFEHVIPKKVAREMMIYKIMTIDEALNIPTCWLRKDKHQALNKMYASTTPDVWDFWARYRNAFPDIAIQTWDGKNIDVSTWDIANHYEYFK
jgi:hypothetical protein